MSPNLAARFAPNFTPQLSAQLHPNVAAQLGQVPNIPNLPPNLAQLAQMTPSLSSQLNPNLQAQLSLGPNHGLVPQHVNPSTSLDEMFSRKRGRPPKNRVVEVWTDNVSVTLNYNNQIFLILTHNTHTLTYTLVACACSCRVVLIVKSASLIDQTSSYRISSVL